MPPHFKFFILFGLLVLFSCTGTKLSTFEFPNPIDTSDRPVSMQEKGSWTIDGVTVSNEFDGARMNEFSQIDASTFQILIRPENEPINISPWYAFKISSDRPRTINIVLEYGTYKHRYWPKLSRDLEHWTPIDSMDTDFSGPEPKFTIEVNQQPLYFCGQELTNSSVVWDWFDQVIEKNNLNKFKVGESRLGRPIYGAESVPMNEDAETIVFLSRQHPPEVTGFKALQSYLDEVMNDSHLSTDFRKKYRILIYPLMNPDGVDLGHWRHNAGGIDLNRDWGYYRQPEVRQVANHIFDYVMERKSDVILGIDFHSTQEDVYYTYPDEHEHIMNFRNYWIEGIQNIIGAENAYEDPDPLESPVSKGWFVVAFGADGITYEVGDETPRDFIDMKARVSAREMMKLLILR